MEGEGDDVNVKMRFDEVTKGEGEEDADERDEDAMEDDEDDSIDNSDDDKDDESTVVDEKDWLLFMVLFMLLLFLMLLASLLSFKTLLSLVEQQTLKMTFMWWVEHRPPKRRSRPSRLPVDVEMK